MQRFIKVFIKDERGFAAILFVIMMPVLIALAGLVIDGGLIMCDKAKLEAATEAAALSTIAAYDPIAWEESGEIIINQDAAKVYAQKYLKLNLPMAEIDSCTVDLNNPSKVILTTNINVKVVFMKVFGISERKIRTQVISHGR